MKNKILSALTLMFVALTMMVAVPSVHAARTVPNPCYVSSAPGTPTQAHGNLYGAMYVDCARRLQPNHDRVATVTYIEKWKPQYGKYMTYRAYSDRQVWGWGAFRGNQPSAKIRCDGHGLYRVRTGVYTYSSTGKVPPSKFRWSSSPRRDRCQGTRPQPLHLVNNP